MHENGIFHRDLKPNNILIFDRGNTFKLADLGFSREVPKPGSYLTKTKMGAQVYIPPEVLYDSEPVSFKGDMYQLGIILHFLMAKKTPDYLKFV